MDRNRNTVKIASIDVPKIVEHFHEVPYLDPDICYEQYKDMVIDPFKEQTIHLSAVGFDRGTMFDRIIEQMGRQAGQKMFLNYIYGIDPADIKHQSWEIIISPLWSETLYRVRPIDIRKGGWKCRKRMNVDSTLVHTAGIQMSIQKPHQAQSRD